MVKRVLLPALMTGLLLAGCGAPAAEERLEQRRDALRDAPLQFTLQARSTLDREVFDCALAVSSAPGETAVEVAAPASVAGVRAVAGAEGTALRYDAVALDLGRAAEDLDGPVPLAVRLCAALREGHVLRAWAERDGDREYLAAEVYMDEDHGLTLRFAEPDLTPAAASVAYRGAEIFRCTFENFTTE